MGFYSQPSNLINKLLFLLYWVKIIFVTSAPTLVLFENISPIKLTIFLPMGSTMKFVYRFIGYFFLICFWLQSCTQETSLEKQQQQKLFSLLANDTIGIDFSNNLQHTEAFNAYTYRNFYNGAGVAIGDINNDGLVDIYFCGNQVDNKLFLNKGGFKFEDITATAGVACSNVWSTGASMADINGDGLLDLYVCKSGPPEGENRNNELFINNGDLTFTEMGKAYNLADKGLSNHAAFFDYDHDGDLDCYLLNNSLRSIGVYDLKIGQREIRDPNGGNKLYRNDGDYFTDVSESAGIYGSAIGFGLGVTIADVNKDGWQDIYVSNDFFERDYLYINQKNGRFTETLEDQINEISYSSMGADVADINNDGFPEIFVTDMLPESEERLKTKTQFENWDKYQLNVKNGYHRQFTRNVLQLNNGDNSFSEIGRLLNVDATDWSWGAIIADFDNDLNKDIFVANGIYKDLTDQDYINFFSDPSIMQGMIKKDTLVLKKLIDAIPSSPISNYIFSNTGNLAFTNRAKEWGLAHPGFSNGAAYADLDNDGDLDLVINNVNSQASIYQNNNQDIAKNNYLKLILTGNGSNTHGFGAQVTLFYQGGSSYQEQNPVKGYLSSMDHRMHFGLGAVEELDSLIIKWPSGNHQMMKNVSANQTLQLNEKMASENNRATINSLSQSIFSSSNKLIDYIHTENDFVDFDRDRLLFHMRSNEGPKVAIADVNNDKLEDLYVGGAKGQPGSLLLQQKNGSFVHSNMATFSEDKGSEDTDAIFVDVDGDEDLDLYVTSGGNEFASSAIQLRDRLYLNDGMGNFEKSSQLLPTKKKESSGFVEAIDFDNDGDTDLLVGVRLIPFLYGVPVNVYLLENDGRGNFADVTRKNAPSLLNIGMSRDAKIVDIENDGDDDLVLCGDWMPLKIFINTNGNFEENVQITAFKNSDGFWNTIETGDFNNDGLVDFVAGNHGLNSNFKASEKAPISMIVNDFDKNGSAEQLISVYNEDKAYPLTLRNDLITQLPKLKKKYLKFENYKYQTVQDMFSKEELEKSIYLKACEMASCIYINQGNSQFKKIPLPIEAQLSPTFAIMAKDLNNDGVLDIVLGGNFSKAKPETGNYHAGYGLALIGDGNGHFKALNSRDSGIKIKGEIRDIKTIKISDKQIVLIVRNNDTIKMLDFNEDR